VSEGDFWRTDEGLDAYEALLQRRLAHFESEASRRKTFKGSAFDVMTFSDFPGKGLQLHCTAGLSHYILEKEDGQGVREELVWTARADHELDYIENVLLNLGTIVLNGRRALPGGVLLDNLPLSVHLPSEVTVTTLLTRVGFWLQEEEFLIKSTYSTYFVETVPLTRSEVEIYRVDPSRFANMCEAGTIDVLNLRR